MARRHMLLALVTICLVSASSVNRIGVSQSYNYLFEPDYSAQFNTLLKMTGSLAAPVAKRFDSEQVLYKTFLQNFQLGFCAFLPAAQVAYQSDSSDDYDGYTRRLSVYLHLPETVNIIIKAYLPGFHLHTKTEVHRRLFVMSKFPSHFEPMMVSFPNSHLLHRQKDGLFDWSPQRNPSNFHAILRMVTAKIGLAEQSSSAAFVQQLKSYFVGSKVAALRSVHGMIVTRIHRQSLEYVAPSEPILSVALDGREYDLPARAHEMVMAVAESPCAPYILYVLRFSDRPVMVIPEEQAAKLPVQALPWTVPPWFTSEEPLFPDAAYSAYMEKLTSRMAEQYYLRDKVNEDVVTRLQAAASKLEIEVDEDYSAALRDVSSGKLCSIQ